MVQLLSIKLLIEENMKSKYYIYIASETRIDGMVTSLNCIKFPCSYEIAVARANEQRKLIKMIDKLRRP